jgi:hypothetical protein
VPPVIIAFDIIGYPYIIVFVRAKLLLVVTCIEGNEFIVIVFATALKVTGVFALSTAITLNVTGPPMAFVVVIKRELNVIVPSELVTIVLYDVPGVALAPLICIGILLDTNIRFAVIGNVPPEINTLYVTY